MARLDTAVLVYSPIDRMELTEALEPVVARFRSAENFSEACRKVESEKMDLVVLGYEHQAQQSQDIPKFYQWLKTIPIYKTAPVYFWADEESAQKIKVKDPQTKVFHRGRYSDLLSSLDAFVKDTAPIDMAQQMKTVLPLFVEHLQSHLSRELATYLGKRIQVEKWSYCEAPEADAFLRAQSQIFDILYTSGPQEGAIGLAERLELIQKAIDGTSKQLLNEENIHHSLKSYDYQILKRPQLEKSIDELTWKRAGFCAVGEKQSLQVFMSVGVKSRG